MNETTQRVIRTLLQLIVGGGLTWLTDQLAKDLPTAYVPYMLGAYTVVVVLAQNYLEETGKIRKVFKGQPQPR